jgi:hypothetical protein
MVTILIISGRSPAHGTASRESLSARAGATERLRAPGASGMPPGQGMTLGQGTPRPLACWALANPRCQFSIGEQFDGPSRRVWRHRGPLQSSISVGGFVPGAGAAGFLRARKPAMTSRNSGFVPPRTSKPVSGVCSCRIEHPLVRH